MHDMATEVTLVVVIGILLIGAVATIANRIGVAAPLLLVVLGERMLARRAWAVHVAEVDPDDATTDGAQISRLRRIAIEAERVWLDRVRRSGRFDSGTAAVAQRIIDCEEIALRADEDEH